jgi:adenosylhomocysteine nucleosidase
VTELAIEDPCVVFALGREAAPFYREFRPQQRFPRAPCRARFCGPAWLPILALETGLGPDRAGAAVDWVLGSPLFGNLPYRPRVVLSAGFAGGLGADSRVGDIVLATEIVDSQANCWPTTWPERLPAGRWQPPLRRGRIVTVPALASTSDDKSALAERSGAVAVDMESAVLARRCQERGVPFGCVRAISDDVHTSLSPALAAVLSGSRVAPLRLLVALARSPGLIREARRLARDTRHAADRLSQALGELLTLTLPWGTSF